MPARVESAGVVQPDVGRETEQKTTGLQGDWGCGVPAERNSSRRSYGERHTQARTAGEFLMSEDLTGDRGGDRRARRGELQDRHREEKQIENRSPCHLVVLVCVYIMLKSEYCKIFPHTYTQRGSECEQHG